MPLWDFLLNRFGTSGAPVGASTTYYGTHHRLSRGWDKTDISPYSDSLSVYELLLSAVGFHAVMTTLIGSEIFDIPEQFFEKVCSKALFASLK
jgi:hypothetical protein